MDGDYDSDRAALLSSRSGPPREGPLHCLAARFQAAQGGSGVGLCRLSTNDLQLQKLGKWRLCFIQGRPFFRNRRALVECFRIVLKHPGARHRSWISAPRKNLDLPDVNGSGPYEDPPNLMTHAHSKTRYALLHTHITPDTTRIQPTQTL